MAKENSIKFLTIEELALRWRVSKSWVDKAKALHPEMLPNYIKIGRLIRFPLDEVIKYEQQSLNQVEGE
ncbi:hypothetical protein [Pseudoalteromonas sp. PAR1]|uniref:hypothetical protein n=1 Tax=Pseudomonadati TaxID=3379134 RepID=UPI00248BCBF7|nr:hypothetical protein [Pseudoalteromonas sp. PAR1]